MMVGDVIVRYARAENAVGAEVGDETIIFNSQTGEYHSLGGVGVYLWEILKQPYSLYELLASVCRNYEISKSSCQEDVEKFLDELMQRNLLKIVD